MWSRSRPSPCHCRAGANAVEGVPVLPIVGKLLILHSRVVKKFSVLRFFCEFRSDFNGLPPPPPSNYRFAPALCHLQHHLFSRYLCVWIIFLFRCSSTIPTNQLIAMWKHSPTVHGNNANSSPTLSFIREKIKSILCILLCVIVIVSMTVLNAPVGLEHSRLRVTRPRNFLDGCRHVYIDMGTNIGIQIRKLYEPHLYKDALILQYFSEIFQNDTSGVCSVGFEANPVHDKYLREFPNLLCEARLASEDLHLDGMSARRRKRDIPHRPCRQCQQSMGREDRNGWLHGQYHCPKYRHCVLAEDICI